MYKLTSENYVIKGDIRFSIADSPEYPNTNTEYLSYREWLDAGGVPEPADPVPEPERIAAINASARNYLFSTDWYVIRLQETGQPVPDDVIKLRAEARASVIDTPPQ
jgi:hypothetical protein